MTGFVLSLASPWQLVFSVRVLALLADAALKGTLFLLLAGLLVMVLRRNSAAVRHLVWTLAVAAMLALPVAWFTMPAWNVPVLSQPPAGYLLIRAMAVGPQNQTPTESVPADAGYPAWPEWLLCLWAAGFAVVAGRSAAGELRLRRFRLRAPLLQTRQANSALSSISRLLGISRPVELRTTAGMAVPFTWRSLHPVVVLPAEARNWPQSHLELVLAHELAHVRRYDNLTQMLAQAAVAVFWFHPLVWMAASQMRQERERACDDLVLSFGHPAADYAEVLLTLGRRLRGLEAVWPGVVSMAQPCQLEVRMKALLDRKVNHNPLPARRAWMAASLALALLLPVAAIRATGERAATISGTVRAPGGTVVAGAEVTIINTETIKKTSDTTGTDGSFEFSVPAGRYRAVVTKPGFASTTIPEFELKPTRNVLIVAMIGRPVEQAGTQSPHAEKGRHQRIRVGGKVEQKKRIYGPPPHYPPLAKAAGVQGVVKLDAVIGKDGMVQDLRVLSGPPLLVKASLDAVKDWRYRPTLLNGVPIEVETTITISFTLAK